MSRIRLAIKTFDYAFRTGCNERYGFIFIHAKIGGNDFRIILYF